MKDDLIEQVLRENIEARRAGLRIQDHMTNEEIDKCDDPPLRRGEEALRQYLDLPFSSDT